MPQQQSPFLEGKYGWSFGESGWNTGMDENLLKFSFMFDRNVDAVVSSLPAAVNGQAYFLTSDNRLYFCVGTIWYSSPVPKWFEFKIRSTGDVYQFNGTSAVQIESPAGLDARLDTVELTLSTLGSAAFEDVSFFATQAELDVVEAQGTGYTDTLRQELANSTGPVTGAGQVGFSGANSYPAETTGRALSAFVCVDWFGATSDGVADDTVAIRAAISKAQALGVGIVYLGRRHRISETITIPAGITLEGQGRGCRIIPTVGGTYTGGFLFLINSTDGANWTVPFPNTMSGGLRNVTFWNGDVAGTPTVATLRGVRGFGSCVISQIRGRNMTQMVSRPSGGIYSDSFDVDDIYCEPVIGAEYQVDIRGLGDGLRVGKLHFPYNAINPGTGTPLGLYVAGTYGGRIGECIGGDVFITQSKVVIENGHYERATITVDSANIDMRSTCLSASTRIPLILLNNGGHESVVTLDGCEFGYLAGLQEWQGSDISIATGVTLEVRNSYRRYTKNASLDKSQMHGLTIETNTGTPLTSWNRYSYALSRQGRIYRGHVVDQTFSVPSLSASFIGISSAAVDSTESWGIASGTYYYQAQYMLDTGRLVGRTGTAGEQSVALTNGDSGTRLTIDFNGKPTAAILRVYRGTSAGSYSHFVDIPVFSARLFYDSGAALNGYPWQSRTAGAVDTINGLGETYFEIAGGSAVIRGATVPTVGTWPTGDDVYRTAPAAAGKRAWVCTTAGTPGTWKPWGAIDA